MRKLALRVEHQHDSKILGVHLLEAELTSIGSGPTAKIRLPGDDVAGLHAAFDLDADQGRWMLRDLGSAGGTRVNQKLVIEHALDQATVIQIGRHQLKATPFVIERELFKRELDPTQGQHQYHQVVVLKNGLVQRSLLLEPTEAFEGHGVPRGPEWVTTEVGDLTIKQRLVKSDLLKGRDRNDERRAWPAVVAAIAIVLISGLMLMVSHSKESATPPENQYTRMIFDGQKVRQKKIVAEKMRKNLAGQTQTGVAKTTAGGDAGQAKANNQPPAGAKVVVNLKSAGLGALIGKVAARASKNTKLIAASGVAAGQSGAGRALSLGGGSALDKLGQTGTGTGGTLKVGGLGTAGKGGGTSGYKGSGALAQGNVGNAEVGVLEEESEVDGGLDKEAIARVIRSQLGQIRYCYERQLSASPDLYGKIMIKFTIGSVGAVTAQAIGNTSLNNAMVEGCILRRVAGWQFPVPKGGTNVMVTYPFLFKSTR